MTINESQRIFKIFRELTSGGTADSINTDYSNGTIDIGYYDKSNNFYLESFIIDLTTQMPSFIVSTTNATMIPTNSGASTASTVIGKPGITPTFRTFHSKEAFDAGIIFNKTTNTVVCQCGADKHGFASHSNWCDIKD